MKRPNVHVYDNQPKSSTHVCLPLFVVLVIRLGAFAATTAGIVGNDILLPKLAGTIRTHIRN